MEPIPTKEFKEKFSDDYERVSKKPIFLLIKAKKIK
jgi:hypothetical protein